jgi:hypothetical protein
MSNLEARQSPDDFGSGFYSAIMKAAERIMSVCNQFRFRVHKSPSIQPSRNPASGCRGPLPSG